MALNAQHFLKQGGNFVISVKASCIDSTATPEAVFASEVKTMQGMQLKPKEQARAPVCCCRCLRSCARGTHRVVSGMICTSSAILAVCTAHLHTVC